MSKDTKQPKGKLLRTPQSMDNLRTNKTKGYYIFSPFVRIYHWTMVICVLILFFTGLYIGNPALLGKLGEPTYVVGHFLSMENIRKLHFFAAFILTTASILRLYGALVEKGDRLFPRFWRKEFYEGAWWAVKHYLFVKTDERFYLRNQLARFSYLAIYVMIFILIITGAAMYSQIYPNVFYAQLFAPINDFLTEYGTHQVHHILSLILILFVIIHVYLAFRADLTEHNGEISSMFSGIKYFPADVVPYDIHDILDNKADIESNLQRCTKEHLDWKQQQRNEAAAK